MNGARIRPATSSSTIVQALAMKTISNETQSPPFTSTPFLQGPNSVRARPGPGTALGGAIVSSDRTIARFDGAHNHAELFDPRDSWQWHWQRGHRRWPKCDPDRR